MMVQELREEGVPMHPLVLVLDNVRSAFNVGSIFRTAETARVEEVRRPRQATTRIQAEVTDACITRMDVDD